MGENLSDISVPKSFHKFIVEETKQQKAGSIGKRGYFNITTKVGKSGKTFIEKQYVTLPFHITRGMYIDRNFENMAFIYSQNPTGGIIQGDRQITNIECKEDSMVHVTSQGASKVQMMNANYACSEITLKVYDNAVLEYLPEPVILYAGSRFFQRTNIEVGSGSTVFYSEITVPGRIARGEEFQFKLYQSDITVKNSIGDLLFRDRVIIDPEKTDLGKQGPMGGYKILGNFYLISPGKDHEKIIEAIRSISTRSDDVAEGITLLPNNSGILFRVLGMSTKSVNETISRVWNELRQNILGAEAPNLRKY